MSPAIPLKSTVTLGLFLVVAALSRPLQADTMKAVRFDAYGPAGVMRYVDVAKPEPAAGEALVRVRAAGVNPIDWKIRDGSLRDYGDGLPGIPGFDIAGDVAALGTGVHGYKVGDAVFARLHKTGGYAEYVAVEARLLAPKPANIDYAHAAAIPTGALTAYDALFDQAQLKRGQTVLIHGASGGVGHLAVQLAKNAGATVIGTGSATNEQFVKDLGVDVFVDYRTQRFEDYAKDVDVVLDTVGGETLQRSYAVVKRGGIIVSIVAGLDSGELKRHGLREPPSGGLASSTRLNDIAKLFASGALKTEVGATFPLQEAAQAHIQSETGHARGKLVLIVDETASD